MDVAERKSRPILSAVLGFAFIASFVYAVGYNPIALWATWAILLAYFVLCEPDNPGPAWLLVGIGIAVLAVWSMGYLPGSRFEEMRLASEAPTPASREGD